jgi:hypothetical protein
MKARETRRGAESTSTSSPRSDDSRDGCRASAEHDKGSLLHKATILKCRSKMTLRDTIGERELAFIPIAAVKIRVLLNYFLSFFIFKGVLGFWGDRKSVV